MQQISKLELEINLIWKIVNRISNNQQKLQILNCSRNNEKQTTKLTSKTFK